VSKIPAYLWREVRENWLCLKRAICPAMTISSRRYLLPFEEVAKYLGFAKSVADSKGFRGIKPKYLTTAELSGILKRYRLEETAIAS